MTGLIPIFKRELRAYFRSPVAYVVIAMFLLITAYFYYNNLALFSIISMQAIQNPSLAQELNFTEMVLNSVFRNMGVIFLFLAPLLTMRLFSEEKRTGTIELLLTWPVKDLGVALGKFGAALGLVVVMLVLTGTYPALMSGLGQVELGPIFSGYLGIFLMSAALIALGMWFSSLTENQIIAGTLTLVVSLLLWVIGWAGTFIKHDLMRAVISEIAIAGHLDNFAKGVIDTRDVIYYLSFTAFFIFLTLRSLESRLRRV